MLIKHTLLFTLFILISSTNTVFSQTRNEQVMQMNQIIKMMDEFSFVNQQAYFDAVNLHAFFSNFHNLTHPENSLYTEKTKRVLQTGSYSGIEKYYHLIPEVKPDEKGMIPFYYSFFYKWLWEWEQIEKLVKSNKIWPEILPHLTNYMSSADSLFETQNG